MKKILLAALLLASAASAQEYAHRSNPGPGRTTQSISAAGLPAGQCIGTNGASTVIVAIVANASSAVGSFVGTNFGQGDASPDAVNLYPYNTTTGTTGTNGVSTFAATGTWVGPSYGFAQICVYFASAPGTAVTVRLDADPAVFTPAPQNPGTYTIGGTVSAADAGFAVLIANDGGPNRIYCPAFSLNLVTTGQVDLVAGPYVNVCATDGGVEKANTLDALYLTGPSGEAFPPWSIVTKTPGQSLCSNADAGFNWSGNCVFAP